MSDLEDEVAELERTQFGLVSLDQVRELEMSNAAFKHRVGRKRHVRAARGVWASPSVESTFDQKVMAAVLSGGVGAFSSHECAAQAWGFPTAGAALIEISSSDKRRPRVNGVLCHRTKYMGDVTTLRGIRISTPERTIIDLSGRVDLRLLGRMVDHAIRNKLTTLIRLREATNRLCPAPGRSRRKMLQVLDARDEQFTDRESVLEDFVYEAIARFGLPLPVPQHKVVVNGHERRIDLCYPDSMLALEPKGFDRRRERTRFDDDALRENELAIVGFDVLTFTSAFSDWKIAAQVAAKLGLPVPPRPERQLSFAEWNRRRK
jgi:hypothetical protein